MKILELAEFYSEQGGGVRTYIAQKFEAAHAAGHMLSVLAPGVEDGIERRRGGKLIWVKSPAIPFDKRYHLFWNQQPIDEIVAAERPDFIEGSSPWRGAWFAGRQNHAIPKALFIHQDPVLTYPQTILRKFFTAPQIDRYFAWFFCYFRQLQKRYQTSVVASAWLADRLENAGMQRPLVVPFGVRQEEFSGAARSDSLRLYMLSACGVHYPNAKLLVTISRHHPEKRIPLMIEAFQKASSKSPMGLYIIGDGPSRAHIEKLAAKTPGVLVAGFIHDRPKLVNMLASADAYIHGCPAETFGLVIAEALCAGLPQIVPDGGGAAEISSAQCAEFYEADSADECAAAITRLFSRDASALRGATLKAAARIGSMSDHFQALFSIYESLVDQQLAFGRIEQLPVTDQFPIRQQVA